MCPGGFVVPAASGANQVVVNGMSPSNRGSRWANAGLVVEFHSEDLTEMLQHELEEKLLDSGWAVSEEIKKMATETDIPVELTLMHFQEQLEALCYLHGDGSRRPDFGSLYHGDETA